MNAQTEQGPSKFDTLKLFIALVLVLGGAVVFSIFKEQSLLLRVAGILTVVGVAIFISMTTYKGKIAWGFLKDARVEVRKVVWPTRQETLQTTLIVVIMVIIVGLILWTMDQVILWVLGMLTGTKG
ncbi:Protein translocase subunit SecE [hydrothermal vent metagenome]|uniref:Protein translocase subunit SecE n=1 Tax=hydrothermal vent metagenome TaxID=652676 RepID=A0A3B0XU00_9ZZZZ